MRSKGENIRYPIKKQVGNPSYFDGCWTGRNIETNFEKHFTKKSLRIDFALSGNWDFQAAAIQQLREEPVWAGPVKNLILSLIHI